jgi:predicted kinase
VISAHGALWSKNILAALPDADSKYPLFLGRARRSDPVRYSDILSDIASLSAELSALGYPALASVFEDYYFSLNPEAYDKNLLCFYKTARLLSLVEESLRQGLDRCWERASRIISSAAANALGMAGPFIIGLGGSDEDARISLAQGIAELLGATEVSLDGESAQLAPLLLNPACCFDRLLLRTRNLVRQGRGVVFSWPMHHEEERLEAAKLAHGLGVPFLLVKCAKSRAEAVSLRTVPIYTDHRSESEMALNKITDCKPWATGVSCSSVHQIYLETVMSQSELILYVLREFSRINRDLNG